MFGIDNKTITKIYTPTFDTYGQKILGIALVVSLKCWLEYTYAEYRKTDGDTYTSDAKIILPYNLNLAEGKIIEITNEGNFLIVMITQLEDFDGNKRQELLLKKES